MIINHRVCGQEQTRMRMLMGKEGAVSFMRWGGRVESWQMGSGEVWGRATAQHVTVH
jgi:galactose mutarotase-like enzyme